MSQMLLEPLHKVYLRKNEIGPDTAPQASARRGFWELGTEIVDFERTEEIQTFDDLGPDVGVSGFISDVQTALIHMRRSLPALVDYPPALDPFLGRYIARGTLGDVRQASGSWFIKPMDDHKLFVGFVYDGGEQARRTIATFPDDVTVWMSETVTFLSEFRCFVLDGKLLDVRRYAGDMFTALDDSVVFKAIDAMNKSETKSIAYCLDFGVTNLGQTLLVEANDSFSFAPYGMYPSFHVKMLSARWREMNQKETWTNAKI